MRGPLSRARYPRRPRLSLHLISLQVEPAVSLWQRASPDHPLATYVQLLTLTSAGREKALHDPVSVLRAQHEAAIPGVQVLGLYAVLGPYDFVNIVEADDSDAIARFSLELGVAPGRMSPPSPPSRSAGWVRRIRRFAC